MSLPEPYYERDGTTIFVGDCRNIIPTLETDSIHSCVTDPPYELGFMGKSWDRSGVAFDPETWQAVYRILKPGGYLLAFGGTRTFHRMTVAIEDAGFEIRDCLSWLYGSGFPKSLNVAKMLDKKDGRVGFQSPNSGKYLGDGDGMGRPGVQRLPNVDVEIESDLAREWDGWGTALKPAWEPIIMARKPFRGTVAANVTEHGTGAINVDGCRIEGPPWSRPTTQDIRGGGFGSSQGKNEVAPRQSDAGRWPANVVIDEDAAAAIDEQSGERPRCSTDSSNRSGGNSGYMGGWGAHKRDTPRTYEKLSGASRFYYCAKASRSERGDGNSHPTVKPLSLMQWLVRMVTPPGGIVLDPFMGSGTTVLAAINMGFRSIGIEMSEQYAEIAANRIPQQSVMRLEVPA